VVLLHSCIHGVGPVLLHVLIELLQLHDFALCMCKAAHTRTSTAC
jgi:hypothetical protein